MRFHSLVFRGITTRAALLTMGAAVTCLAACSPSNPSADAGTPDAGGDSAGPLAVTPATANVLTCDTLQFKETGGAGTGTWSVSPQGAGSVTASGLYSAPTATPANPAASITYTEAPQSASAQVTLATAFLGTPSKLSIGNNSGVYGSPFDHQFTANGATIYGALIDSAAIHAQVFASTDNGATFGAPVGYHTGNVTCATAAVDAGNPKVVYLVYAAGHGDSTGNTGGTVRLAVSTDGATTFPKEYVIADSLNSIADMICPDVISPSPDHVLVVGTVAKSGPLYHVGAFASDSQGANIGPVGTPLTCTACPQDGSAYYAPSDKNASTDGSTHIADDNSTAGARIATNGKGTVCMAYQYNHFNNTPDSTEVQCSTDNGNTWSAIVDLGAPKASGFPTVAVSPGGTVAVAWIDTAPSGTNETFIATSADGGKTFGAPFQVPDVQDPNGFDDVYFQVVAWESDAILWVSETQGTSGTVYLNKTCDGGKTWSGELKVIKGYRGSSLIKTAAGFMLGLDDNQTPALALMSLYPR